MKSLTVASVLELLTPEQQDELYETLKAKRPKPAKDDKYDAETRVKALMDKYFDLVWMARRDEQLLKERPDIRKTFNEVSAKYPGELEKLQSDEGNWTHGFNSGMLACSRLLQPYTLTDDYKEVIDDDPDDPDIITRQMEIDMAEEEFPFLDT